MTSSTGIMVDPRFNLGEGLGDFLLATDAYIYGYPLVTMEMTRRVFTNVARPEGTVSRSWFAIWFAKLLTQVSLSSSAINRFPRHAPDCAAGGRMRFQRVRMQEDGR